MTPDQVLDRLRNGWQLANRGTGWWISEPPRPYKRSGLERVDDLVVEKLKEDGMLTFELPFNTYFARLAETAQDENTTTTLRENV